MQRHRLALWVLVAALTVALAACSRTSGTSAGTPAKATVNGVSAIDTAAGTASLSVSALDAANRVLGSGTITNPSATVVSVTSAGVASQAVYAVTAQVCGDITSSTGDITAALTLDATGSMSLSDPNNLRNDAAKAFIGRMATTDRAAVASFDSSTTPTGSYLAIKVWQDLTSDDALLDTAVDSATFAGGLTNLWDAGVDSVALLAGASGSNKLVVLLTDGEDNSSTKTASDVSTAANNANVRVFTIGLGAYVNSTELAQIAADTGGTFNQVADAADLTGLFDGVFNASQAAGCVGLQFSPAPTSGQTFAGQLSFSVNGTPLSTNYSITFP